MTGGCHEMKKGLFIVLPICLAAGVVLMGEKGIERSFHSEPPRDYWIPAERTYVGTLIFESSRPTLVGADLIGGIQTRRVGGRYVLIVTETHLTIEIYSWGTRELYRRKRYSLEAVMEDYPGGVSVWIEQDETSATIIFISLG